MTDSQQPAPISAPAVLQARAGAYYRNVRYLISLAMVAGGLWSIYDGYYGWPRDNQEAIENRLKKAQDALPEGQKLSVAEIEKFRADTDVPHNDLNIWLNKVMGVLLPPAGVALLIFMLYRSRGAYRLQGQTLHVPGHPPIPLDSIRRIDQTLWDRKGIAYLDYELPTGQTGRVCIDDFVYSQKQTDAIMDRVVAHVQARAG